jgi:hypothetical protein
VYFSSSAVREVMILFWVPPVKLGDDDASMFVVSVFVASSIDHVPKLAVIPCIAILLSAGVTSFMLFEANFGTSDRKIMNEYRPSGSNMARPFGFGPQRSDLPPSLVDASPAHGFAPRIL